MIEAADGLLEAGKLDETLELSERVLGDGPSSAAEMHRLGVIHNQRGEYARAVELMSRAVALRPSVPALHVNLGEAYRNLGQLRRAVSCCRIALHLSPDYPEGLCTLALALHGLGRRQEAAEELYRALTLRPDMAPAHNNLGLVLQELGQVEEAIAHYRRAVELDPGLNRARINLGLALLDRSQAEEALTHFREAVRLQPDLPILYHNIGNALHALDRPVEARAAYLEALQLDPDLAFSHLNIGLTLRHEGLMGEALPWCKQAVALDPKNAFFWEQLAELYGEKDEPGEAIPCWEQVLALSPVERAVTHIGLGSALQDEGRISEAKEHYLIAARLQPDLPSAQMRLGGVYEEMGEMAEAEAAFRAALRLQPNFPLPYGRLGTLLRDKLPDADFAALETRLEEPELAPGPRARLLFALAHVVDGRGDYSRAAACLREANALTSEQPRGHRPYVPADHERFVDGLIRGFDRGFFERTLGTGLETRRPVFVLGMPRSGTTLVEQILASHPLIHGAGELRLGRHSFEAIPSALDRSGLPVEEIPHLNGAAIQRLAKQHMEKLDALDGDRAERIVDKMPDNYLYLGLLSSLFPNAVFIHCRRDLRDVAVSCWMTDFRSIRWANDWAHLASRCRLYQRLMDHWRSVLPVNLHEVNYEETVADLEGVARRLLETCGQEWDPACLEFHRTQRIVRTASVTQVRQPIYTRSVARWKNYERELFELFASLHCSEPLSEEARILAPSAVAPDPRGLAISATHAE